MQLTLLYRLDLKQVFVFAMDDVRQKNTTCIYARLFFKFQAGLCFFFLLPSFLSVDSFPIFEGVDIYSNTRRMQRWPSVVTCVQTMLTSTDIGPNHPH